MDATTFLQQCLTAISLGGAYALIAIGYTLVYGILRLINFAHGDIFMMAGYFMIFAMASMPWYIAIPVVLAATVLLGVLIEKTAYKPLSSSEISIHIPFKSPHTTKFQPAPCQSPVRNQTVRAEM